MRSRIEKLSRAEWERWCEPGGTLPVTCDPDWADAVAYAYAPRLKSTAWRLWDASDECLIVSYAELPGRLSSITLSPFGLPCAVAVRQPKAGLEQPLRWFLGARLRCQRSITFYLPYDTHALAAADRTVSWQSYATHVLQLDKSWDDLFAKQFRGATRTCLRRAEKSGVQVRITRDPSDVEAYYRIHLQLVHEKGNYTDVHPLALLQRIVTRCRRCEFAVACVDDQVIAGGIFLHNENDTFYWHGASDRQFALAQPTYAVLGTMLRRSLDQGRRAFNFGGSAGIESLEKFKESWGAQRVWGLIGTGQHPLLRHAKRLRELVHHSRRPDRSSMDYAGGTGESAN